MFSAKCFRLNIFYFISKQRDLAQVTTTLDRPFPNITTDYINVTMVDTTMFTTNIYNHTYHHPSIPFHGTAAVETILQRSRVDRLANYSNLCESLMYLIANYIIDLFIFSS